MIDPNVRIISTFRHQQAYQLPAQ